MAPGKKAEGVMWLLHENANGFNVRFLNNMKVEKAKELHDKLEADLAAYNEHKINYKQNKVGVQSIVLGG
jgi:hypothetical protein